MYRKIAGAMACALIAGTTHGQVVIGLDDVTQALRSYNTTTGMFEDITTPGFGIRALAADNANRVFYASTGTQLWRIPFDSPTSPELVGNFSGAITSLQGGLGFVPSENILYGTTTATLYTIDPATGVTTLARSLGGDFGGLDFNADDGKLYLSNDSTSTLNGLTGRGIYTIDPPFATGALVEIAEYPTNPTAQTDIDGLAVGGGKVFLSRDLDNNTLYEFDLTSMTYTGPITRPGGTTTSEVFCGATYAPALAVLPPGANVGVALAGDAPCTIAINGTATFTATVSNVGPETATNVTLTVTIPGNVDMVMSTPSGTLVGPTLTINLGSIAPLGSTQATITMRPTAGANVMLSAAVTATEPDAALGNNSASATTVLGPTLPATAVAKGIMSTLASSSSSEVPGIPGARFATGVTVGRPFGSPDGSKFVQIWDTDLATTQDQVIIRSDNGVLSVAVQEGVTQLPTQQGVDVNGPPYFPLGSFDAVIGINNAGQYAFAGVDSRTGTTDDGYVVKWDGAQYVLIAQENVNPPAPIVGVNYGSINEGAHIATNGTVAFVHTVTGLTTATDEIAVRNDGATLVYQEGVTIWGNQDGGLMDVVDDLDFGAIDAGIFFNADHSRYIAGGLLDSVSTTTDDVVVVDGNIVLQEGVIIPGSGFFSPPDQATPYNAIWMEADGTWFIRGDNDDGQDWVLRNGVIIAKTGDPIVPSATENWSEPVVGTAFADTFFSMHGNANGDYVVGGTTNSTDVNSNAVMVLNGTTVLARENDPIDLDNNGMFDDDAFIRTFIDDRALLTNTDFYLVVRIRNSAAAFCGGTDTDLGQALIRIPLPAPSCIADFNNSGAVTVQDIFDFLAAYFTNSPNADVNNSGTITVQDIFDFLAAYFTGCP